MKIEYYDTLPSTNALLKQRAKNEKEGLIIIAGNQTSGRGRFDRRFYSPKDSGIYMSILLKPSFEGFDTTLITTAAAVAVAKSIEELSHKKTQIKWVNDVLLDGKKVCGILTEGCINPQSGRLEYVILGIGINAFAPRDGFDEEIKDIAGFVFNEQNENLKEMLKAQVINKVFRYYGNLTDKSFLGDYRMRSAVIGKEITVIKENMKISATALSIDDNCRLEVRYIDDSTEFLSSGEISIKL